MKEKYKSVGLNYEIILEKYPDILEYEEIVNSYLGDSFFAELKEMLEFEDYEMAKDALKGLYILASELMLFPLYEKLLDLYEDLEFEIYDNLISKYDEMMEVYKKIEGAFNV